jgi:hypothetical protein
MRDEFLATLPENLASGVDKRKLVKNIKSLYRSKGSVRGHEMFFRILFDETSETIYPREQMLKASDGQFDSLKVLRVIASIGDATQLVGRTITGLSSSATAIIENTSTFQIGASTVTQLILNADSIQGTFTVGETVQGTTSDNDDYFIKATVSGIPGTKNITNDGSLNLTSDTITVTAGGVGALFQVEDIGPGSITEIVIDDKGTGYEVADSLVFTNTGTGGNNAAGFVKIVNGGIADQNNSTDAATGVEDRLVLEDETTRGDPYTGNIIMQEKFTDLQTIEEIFLTNGGGQYTSLPTVTVTMRIQDSLYYQDFSYVIKVGRAINDWRDSFKSTMHTSGFYFTGQVNIENQISAQISQPVDGIISGISESPIFGVIGQLFTTIFGRRLGTVDDGTTLRIQVLKQLLMVNKFLYSY